MLLACECVADEVVRSAQAPKEAPVLLSDAEQAAALELLRAPDLVERIAGDFERVGIVGEATNCLVGYLAAVSRMLDRPLAVIVQSWEQGPDGVDLFEAVEDVTAETISV